MQVSLYNGTQVKCVLHRYFPENEDYDVGVVLYSGMYGTCLVTQTACNLMMSMKIFICFLLEYFLYTMQYKLKLLKDLMFSNI